MSEKFDSVNGLKLKLIDSFPEYVPSSPTFQVGYLVGRRNQKRWIVQQEDLKMMYCGVVKEEGHGKRGNENKRNPNPRGRRMRTSRQIRVQLEESMETSIVVQLTHYGQNSFEMGATKATVNTSHHW